MGKFVITKQKEEEYLALARGYPRTTIEVSDKRINIRVNEKSQNKATILEFANKEEASIIYNSIIETAKILNKKIRIFRDVMAAEISDYDHIRTLQTTKQYKLNIVEDEKPKRKRRTKAQGA